MRSRAEPSDVVVNVLGLAALEYGDGLVDIARSFGILVFPFYWSVRDFRRPMHSSKMTGLLILRNVAGGSSPTRSPALPPQQVSDTPSRSKRTMVYVGISKYPSTAASFYLENERADE
ncbi:uncharacterized protein N7498_010103 [Penicillium cinerascens]|uniref:Uncharacterized protein n=1 Tax=Penicillium cinerascens TaxID=70096 RepID=A0A9W9J6S8_9EURO|nr:uncharacterized protein N7498_010103 [Penicillium cinerascens]KAJ5191118.1 hypothetical protein N7498_010103 [Penicillium cinerascens]